MNKTFSCPAQSIVSINALFSGPQSPIVPIRKPHDGVCLFRARQYVWIDGFKLSSLDLFHAEAHAALAVDFQHLDLDDVALG